MGKIQVGQKRKKTVDMGGFTVLPELATTKTVNANGTERLARQLEGSWDYSEDKADKNVDEQNESKDDDKTASAKRGAVKRTKRNLEHDGQDKED